MTCFLERPWGRMAYVDEPGRGPALLFLHGTGCDSADFAPIIARLRDLAPGDARPHMILPEFRGHGMSDLPSGRFSLGDLANDVSALLDALRLDQVILVGHSLGGMVALEVARREEVQGRKRLAGLLLLEGWTQLRAVQEGFEGDRMYVGLAAEQVAVVKKKADHTRERFARDVWQAFWLTVIAFDGTAVLATSPLPIVEAYGNCGYKGGSLGVPERENIHWRWLDGAGHYLPLVNPDWVAQLCVDFGSCLSRDAGD